jgi:hypothetical protein
VVASNQTGFTGTGFVDFSSATGEYVEFTVNVASAGTYALDFRFALSSGSRAMGLTVNGASGGSITFTSTGAWTNWATTTKQPVTLAAGANKIRILTTGQGGPNLDALTVRQL